MGEDLYCPLCGSVDPSPFFRDPDRDYLRCRRCLLVFVHPGQRLSAGAEKREYDLHENSVDDPAYRQFLSRLAIPLQRRLPEGARGLDFGCGPGPALAAMFEESGFNVSLYDIFYYPDKAVLSDTYEFITATEVVEHLYHPGRELDRLWSLLVPGGYLGIMTKLVRDRRAFARWHYKNDATHVCFFSEDTWRWWARRHHALLTRLGADVILLQRSPAN